jgi:hypothetical protein
VWTRTYRLQWSILVNHLDGVLRVKMSTECLEMAAVLLNFTFDFAADKLLHRGREVVVLSNSGSP